ncbi:hypothetical protein D3C85_999580 [compost metagenome]
MNAKKAKFLRRIARRAGSTANNGYITTKHRERLVKTGGLNANGTPELRVITPVTMRNNPQSPRGVYRNLKKLHK